MLRVYDFSDISWGAEAPQLNTKLHPWKDPVFDNILEINTTISWNWFGIGMKTFWICHHLMICDGCAWDIRRQELVWRVWVFGGEGQAWCGTRHLIFDCWPMLIFLMGGQRTRQTPADDSSDLRKTIRLAPGRVDSSDLRQTTRPNSVDDSSDPGRRLVWKTTPLTPGRRLVWFRQITRLTPDGRIIKPTVDG